MFCEFQMDVSRTHIEMFQLNPLDKCTLAVLAIVLIPYSPCVDGHCNLNGYRWCLQWTDK